MIKQVGVVVLLKQIFNIYSLFILNSVLSDIRNIVLKN